MRMILIVIFTAFCTLGAVSVSNAGSYQGSGQYVGTPSAAVTAAFAAYPNGGDGLVAALLALVLSDPSVADDIAWVASQARTNEGQQSAAGAALAQAFIVLTNRGDANAAGHITLVVTWSGNPVLQTAVSAAAGATFGSNPYPGSNPSTTTNAKCTTTTTPGDNTISPVRPPTSTTTCQ
jgi:hypothetical protein